MIDTIRHQDSGKTVVAAKLLTGYLSITKKVQDPDSYIKANCLFDAGFVAHIIAWQGNHGLTADGVIGPATWTAIAKSAPTCSTSKNRISGPTMAVQILLNTNITCDAIYGPRTKAAVATFQNVKGLKADGITGPKTWSAVIVGGAEPAPGPTPEPGTFTQCVDYKQYDSRWGKKMYSNHGDKSQTMSNSGCGPTSIADVVATLKDGTQDPYDMAELSMAWGDRTYSNGTKWTLFIPHIMDHFDFTKAIQSASLEALKACLDAGGYVVCSMAPGYWTKSGHFIVAWKYDSTYIYCCDPASATRKKQEIAQFMKERKQFFCFYPEPKNMPEDNAGGGTVKTPENTVKRGDKICDVARFQGRINWDLLAPELAFVIIKASGLYRNGADTQYANNVKGAISHGLPWHTYSFLYCKTDAEVKRDAALFFNTVYDQGHWPLFWVLDMEAEWGVKDKDAPKLAAAFEAELRRLARENGPGDIRVAAYVAQQKYDDWALDYDHYAYLWIPGYGEKFKPKMPCDMWQYTPHGKLPGINAEVDLDVLMGRKPLEFFTGGV